MSRKNKDRARDKNHKTQSQPKTFDPEKVLELCPVCGSHEFAISKDPTQQRYCYNNSCGNIWKPLGRDQVLLQHYKKEYERTYRENQTLRKQIGDLISYKELAENLKQRLEKLSQPIPDFPKNEEVLDLDRQEIFE